MVLVMLLMYAISVPLVVVAFVDSMWMGIVVNFFCVQSYWCLNEVARDLEDPFVYDPNDLPMSRYQVARKAIFNSCACCKIQSHLKGGNIPCIDTRLRFSLNVKPRTHFMGMQA